MVRNKLFQTENCTCLTHGIFSDVNPKFQEQINKFKVMNQYKKGQVLFAEGAANFGVFSVNSGKIKISRSAPEGRETILRIAGPGDVLGHNNLLTNEKNTYSATMIEDGSVCFLDKKFLVELMASESSVALNIIRRLSHEITASEHRNAAMSNKSVRERLAELLLNLKKSYGVKEGHRTRLDIKLTREEMASIVGTANETIIRFVSEFKEEGILEQEGKVIYLLDEKKLLNSSNVSV